MKSFLGMYDFPEVLPVTDKWYRQIAEQPFGFSAPLALSRDGSSVEEAGEANSLFIGQTCGWPLVLNAKRLQVLAIPKYSARGCQQHLYRSAIIVSVRSSIENLKDLDRYTANNPVKIAVNSRNSCSGCLMLSATLGASILDNASFQYTGAHEHSITRVSSGQADLAAIDCVTFELLLKHRPHHVKDVKVIGYTVAAPALPYVTSIHADRETAASLQRALQEVSEALDDTISNGLFISGFYIDEPDALMHLYSTYIRNLQHLASSPSQYRMYSVDSPPEPQLDIASEPFALKEPLNTTSQEEERIRLQSLQPGDAQYIDELLLQIHQSAETEEVDQGEYSVWKTYGTEHKSVRLIFPGGRGVVKELWNQIRRGETKNELSIVCFLGQRKAVQCCGYNDVDVVVDCWESDAHIVARLNPAVVIAYATGEIVPGGDWGNVVLFQQGHSADSNLMLDRSSVSNDGTALTPQQHGAHRHAIQEVSPWYYREVRIHRALVSLIGGNTAAKEKCDRGFDVVFQRTLHSKFINGVKQIETSESDDAASPLTGSHRQGSRYSITDGTKQTVVLTVRNVFTW